MRSPTTLMTAMVAVALMLPAPVLAAARSGSKAPVKIKVHPKRLWRGYGFLPGYKQPPDNTDWRRPRATSDRDEIRYWRYGQVLYGWGAPGFYRGRYNGGSFGPCWTYTPIGMMPTCGQ